MNPQAPQNYPQPLFHIMSSSSLPVTGLIKESDKIMRTSEIFEINE